MVGENGQKPIRREITDLWADCYGSDAGPFLRQLADRLDGPGPDDTVELGRIPVTPDGAGRRAAAHRSGSDDPEGMPHHEPSCWCWCHDGAAS